MFEKSASDWTLDDLRSVVAAEYAENITFELKQDLPLSDGASGWRARQKLHASERDGLAKEVVAFANAYGGTVVVGVEESDNAPKRAKNLAVPLPNVHELLDRLRSALHACIDPPISRLEIAAILAEDSQDSGYIVLTVPPSIAKPHGFGRPPAVYIRRDDRSEPATMRDQQNMFWESRTDRERVAEEIRLRAENFKNFSPRGSITFQFVAVSAHPIAMQRLARAMREQQLLKHPGTHKVWKIGDASEFPSHPNDWKPTSTGVEHVGAIGSDDLHLAARWEIDESGCVSVTASNQLRPGTYSEVPQFFPGWYSKTAGALLALSDIVSNWAGYSGGWVFSARFIGSSKIQPMSDDRYSALPFTDLSSVVAIRPVAFGPSLPEDDLTEIADRLWTAFGLIRPLEDQSLIFGLEQTLQFQASKRIKSQE